MPPSIRNVSSIPALVRALLEAGYDTTVAWITPSSQFAVGSSLSVRHLIDGRNDHAAQCERLSAQLIEYPLAADAYLLVFFHQRIDDQGRPDRPRPRRRVIPYTTDRAGVQLQETRHLSFIKDPSLRLFIDQVDDLWLCQENELALP